VSNIPPFATEIENEDARQEVEAKLADAPAPGPRLDKVISKLTTRRRRPPEAPAAETAGTAETADTGGTAEATDGAAPTAPAELHVPKAIETMLEW